jgi:hypothetical protein
MIPSENGSAYNSNRDITNLFVDINQYIEKVSNI